HALAFKLSAQKLSLSAFVCYCRPITMTELAVAPAPSDFIRDVVAEDLRTGKHTRIVTRFPPEPNGYLHIGHAKSICLNFGIAHEFNGICNVRMDDTNPTKENRDLIERMKGGEFPDGTRTLRAKIDVNAPNVWLRDPVLYRIRHASHHHTRDKWCVYPMYDWAHTLSDYIEGITHSVCTLE